MHTAIVLFCLAVVIAKVTANPLLQAIQSQTQCPICQQNSLKNQLASSLPMLLNTASNLQLYPQAIMAQNPLPIQGIVQPANPNTLSYPACVPQSAQNQCSQFCPCQPQPTQPSPCQKSQAPNNQINSAIFNKIISNPMIKSILDPRIFNQNGLEAQSNTQCNTAVPNVINNYIIVPTEFLTDDGKCGLKEDPKVPEERRNNNKRAQGRRRRPKPEQPTENRISNETEAEGLPKHRRTRVRDGSEKDSETGRGRRRKSRRRLSKNKNAEVNVQPLNETVTSESDQLDTTQLVRPEKMNETVNHELMTTETNLIEQPTTTLPVTEELVPDKVDVSQMENKIELKDDAVVSIADKGLTVDNVLSLENITSKLNATEATYTSLPEAHVHNSKEISTDKPKKKQNTNSNKHLVNAPRNAREEEVINDFKRKFPNIPEDVVRNLLDHMKRQLAKQGLGFPPSYYPQFPINYDQLYDYPFNYVINTRDIDTNNQNKPKRRKNRRKQNRRKNKIEHAETPQSTTKLITDKNEIETTTVAPTTTEEPIIETTTKPITETVAQTEKETDTIETTTAKNIKETNSIENIDVDNIKDIYAADLGTEDVMPIMFVNGLIDEYYPDFTGDNQYFSDEDFSFIRLEDDKYHYTTDKNFGMEELNRERRRYESHADDYKRPEGKFILRLRKNKNRDRIRPKVNVQERRLNTRPRIGTTKKPKFFENSTERPQIRVTVINEEYLRPISGPREEVTEKPKFTEGSAETKIAQEIEEIQFRTPPTLEKVDFETKQINKNFYDLDFKTSTYSEAKVPQYVSEKSKKHKALDEIETVYARSKVVTYGKPITEEIAEEIAEPDAEQENKGEKKYLNFLDGNDGTSFVVAQSIPGGYW